MSSAQHRVVALIPARAGSKRIRDKNVRVLGQHPLLAYTIAAALESNVFARVVVSTDSDRYAAIARHYGAEVPGLRPAHAADDTSPDIAWVAHCLESLAEREAPFDAFSILRPTSPFRRAVTIQRAWRQFIDDGRADSLRAVEPCAQHPGKMWVMRGRRLLPLLPLRNGDVPWHSSQSAALPEVFVQNASLEIAWTRVVFEGRTIAGESVMPFLTDHLEGFDLNSEDDWQRAEQTVARDRTCLPAVRVAPWEP